MGNGAISSILQKSKDGTVMMFLFQDMKTFKCCGYRNANIQLAVGNKPLKLRRKTGLEDKILGVICMWNKLLAMEEMRMISNKEEPCIEPQGIPTFKE